MNIPELLHACADILEQWEEHPTMQGKILVWPHGKGRFPFLGGGTEKLNETQDTSAYFVPVHRVLSGISKGLKAKEVEALKSHKVL
jgi:hypothetical protein